MTLFEVCQWIENSPSSNALRESVWVFPIIESSHVLGLAFSVGTAVWFDLRLAGLSMRRYSVSETFGYVKTWMFGGFALMMITGVFLFHIKLILLLLAGMNIVIFHWTIDRRRTDWDKAPIPPPQARFAGFASLVLWMSIVAVGRLMAYTL
jgi:hypothetical protein